MALKVKAVERLLKFDKETAGSCTISLTKQEDGRTWQNAASAYLLPPSSQPASVSVNITIGGTTKTYT